MAHAGKTSKLVEVSQICHASGSFRVRLYTAKEKTISRTFLLPTRATGIPLEMLRECEPEGAECYCLVAS
jgi:hypothetical protein